MSQTVLRIASDGQRALPKKIPFTIQSLAALKVPAGKDRVWVYDSKVPHLAFLKTATGSTSFYWTGRAQGRPIRHRLGDGTLSIEQARKLAQAIVGKVAGGADPQAERKTARAEWTFKQLFDWYYQNHSKPRKRTASEDQQKFDLHLSGWSSRRFTSITRSDVARLHAAIGIKTPGAANRVLALVSSIYGRARDIGFDGVNPALGVRKFPEHRRERFLQADELPRFFNEGLKAITPDWQDFFELLLLTGARAGNLLSAKWSDVNLESSIWTIPAEQFKSGQSHTIALVREAVAILKRRHDEQSADSSEPPEFVFPSREGTETGHLTEYKKAWRDLCKAAKLVDFHVHDLRHSHATYLAATGANLSSIGRALGHRQLSTTTRYINLNLDPVRKAVGISVGAMMKLAKKKVKK